MNKRSRHRTALAAGLLFSACTSVELSPAAIARAEAPDEVKSGAIAAWRDAVALANEFLASDARRTLPAGRYELDESLGMRFVTDHDAWPIAVRCNWYGDLCVAFGFAAQEREYGFVVGEVGAERDRLVDNSFLAYDDGSRKEALWIAELLLHETTHVVWREGTVGFWNGVAYYLEAIFLFRTNDHSDERRPRATGEEFLWFTMTRDPDELARTIITKIRDDHLASPHDHCEHGPFPEAPPSH